MITSYAYKQLRGYPGAMDGVCNHQNTKSRTNPAKAQTGTLTVGGTASDGDYVASFYHPDEPNNPIVVTFTREDSETNNQISAALNALLVKALILKATATVVNAVNTIAFGNPKVTYTVTTSAPGTGTLVWAQTIAAGGEDIPFGRAVGHGGDGTTMRMLTTGDVIANVLGVLIRELTVQHDRDSTDDDALPPGRDGAVLGDGTILMECEEAVGPADTVYIRIVASGVNTKIGVVGKSADGGNCISAASIMRFEGTTTAAGQVVPVLVHVPLMKA